MFLSCYELIYVSYARHIVLVVITLLLGYVLTLRFKNCFIMKLR